MFFPNSGLSTGLQISWPCVGISILWQTFIKGRTTPHTALKFCHGLIRNYSVHSLGKLLWSWNRKSSHPPNVDCQNWLDKRIQDTLKDTSTHPTKKWWQLTSHTVSHRQYLTTHEAQCDTNSASFGVVLAFFGVVFWGAVLARSLLLSDGVVLVKALFFLRVWRLVFGHQSKLSPS